MQKSLEWLEYFLLQRLSHVFIMISVSFCHNVKSLEVVGETLALQFFVDIFFFILKKDEIAINEVTVSLDNVVGKVLHHA